MHPYKINSSFLLLLLLCLSFFIPTAQAHRAKANEIDTCRFSVGGEVVHFSAYTPSFTEGASYCHFIPDVGVTHLVFDYEGKKLRHTTVEFEITKEPEGSRVFYQRPEKFKKGSMNTIVDFSQYGAGHYLAHITIESKGETLDSHVAFSIAVEPESEGLSFSLILIFIITLIIGFSIMRFFIKQSDD